MDSKNTFDPLAWASQTSANKNNEQEPSTYAPVSNPQTAAADIGSELARAKATVSELIRLGANIADSYQDWWNCGCALAELGSEARDLFHQVSSQSTKYRESDCEKKWQECLKKRDGRISIATFYDMARQVGVDLSAIARQFPSAQQSSKPQKPHCCEGNSSNQENRQEDNTQNNNNQTNRNYQTPSSSVCATATHGGEETEDLRFSFSRTFSQDIDPGRVPVTLRQAMEIQDMPEERDKVLLSSLTLLAMAEPNVYGIYGEKRVYTPFYLFILGPAGISHKGAIDDVKQLLMPIEHAFRKQYYAQLAEYKEQHAEWEVRKAKHGRSSENAGQEPEEPQYRSMFVSADSSAAAFKSDLYSFGGRAIIFSTEADTLTQALSQEWGQFTDILRMAFHHETITSTRTKDKQHIVIDEPQLGMLVTCTPKQITSLLSPKQNENGSSSRDLFYCTKENLKWLNPFRSKEPLADRYREIGQTVKQMYDLLVERKDKPIQILLTEEQQQAFNTHFQPLLPEQVNLYGIEFAAFIVRIALVAFRMMMVLTTLRQFEHGQLADQQQQAFVCTDDDYNTAMTIIDCLVAHTAYVYSTLLRPSDDTQPGNQLLKPREQLLYTALPEDFTTQQFEQTSKTLGIPIKSAQRYLGNLISRYQLVSRICQGHYAKQRH